MASANKPFGFQPYRNLAGGIGSAGMLAAMLPVSCETCLMPGDPIRVRTLGGNTVQRCDSSASTQDTAFGWLGAITALYDSNKKPLMNKTGGPFLNKGEAGYVEYLPFTNTQTWLIAVRDGVSVSINKTANATGFGVGMRVSFEQCSTGTTSLATGSTIVGRSLFEVAETTLPLDLLATVSAGKVNPHRHFHGYIVSFPAGGPDVGMGPIGGDKGRILEVVVDGSYFTGGYPKGML